MTELPARSSRGYSYLVSDITGGIPPDSDHVALFTCSFRGCGVSQEDEPLVVVAAAGKMAALCERHLVAVRSWRKA